MVIASLSMMFSAPKTMATPEMISEMAVEMVRALKVTMDPTALQLHRQQAYTAYEQFKVIKTNKILSVASYLHST